MDSTAAVPAQARRAALERQWWVVCAGVIAGVALGVGGAAALLTQARPVYASTVSVLVQRIGATEVSLPTEAQLARSTQTAADAAKVVGRTAEDIAGATRVTPLADSSVLLITVEGASPGAAQAAASAVAQAYLANRTKAAQAAIADQVLTLNSRIAEWSTQLAQLNTRLAKLPATSPELATLRGSVTTVTAQITTLSARVTELETIPVDPGQVIAEPDRPVRPIRPLTWLYLGAGAIVGALLGALAVVGRRRLARRVRGGVDLQTRTGVPVLAHVPTQVHLGLAREAGGRAFNRLRNEVMAALGTDDRVILVTGASPGPASTLVATNLAAAFARADTEVVLVGANPPEPGTPPLSQIFDIADIPGLTDVLTGRISLPGALQRAARLPRLRVLTPGGTASAAGLLQSEGARSAVHALCRQARYVVVEAPSTASGADAQSLARVADAVILVVETGRSRHAQVVDAAQQFRLVGTRLLGAVLLSPPLPPSEEPPSGRTVTAGPEDVWLGEVPTIVDGPTTKLRQLLPPTPTLSSSSSSASSPGAPPAPRATP